MALRKGRAGSCVRVIGTDLRDAQYPGGCIPGSVREEGWRRGPSAVRRAVIGNVLLRNRRLPVSGERSYFCLMHFVSEDMEHACSMCSSIFCDLACSRVFLRAS